MADDQSKDSSMIYDTHDLGLEPKNLFKSVRHAKKILAKVAIEFFEEVSDSTDGVENLESFLKGTLKPQFVTSIEEIGYFPDPSAGCFFIAVLVNAQDSDEIKFDKWKKTLSVIQPSTGEFFTKSIVRIYLDFYNDEERARLNAQIDEEIAKEDKEKND